MKLATFIAPGGSEPAGRRGARRRGRRVRVRHGPRPPRLRRPHARRRRARTRSPTSRCSRRSRARARSSASAATTPRTSPSSATSCPTKPLVFLKLPTLERAAGRPGQPPAVVSELDYEAELALVIGAGRARSPATRSPTTSPRATCSAPRSSGRAPRASTRSCPWGPWITTVDELPTPATCAITTQVNGEQRQDGDTDRPDLRARRSSSTSSPRRARSSPATIILTGTPDGRRRGVRPAALPAAPAMSCACEIEGLGSIEHAVSAQCDWMTRSIRPYSAA